MGLTFLFLSFKASHTNKPRQSLFARHLLVLLDRLARLPSATSAALHPLRPPPV